MDEEKLKQDKVQERLDKIFLNFDFVKKVEKSSWHSLRDVVIYYT